MLQPVITQAKPIFCLRHKKQIATHLCTDTKCNNNPILCSQCMNESINRSYHYDHQKSVLPMSQAVDTLCEIIKNQTNPIQRIYKATLGRGDFSTIVSQLERGGTLIQELDDRITTIKNQIDLQLQLLIKEFQKILLLQKQQYFRQLENYQRTFIKSIEFIKVQTQPIIDFQSSMKYYSNKNNFYLKMASQLSRKSDWIMKTKKTLLSTSKNIQNTSFTNELNNILSVSNRIKLDIWPAWKGEDTIQKNNQLKFVIKRAINQWAFIPQLKSLEEQLDNSPQTPQTNSHLGIIKNYYAQTNGK